MQIHALNLRHYLYSLKVINNFTSCSTTKDWVVSPYVLPLHGLPLPPKPVFVTVNEALVYLASTAF
jgi:hypothetical protein